MTIVLDGLDVKKYRVDPSLPERHTKRRINLGEGSESQPSWLDMMLLHDKLIVMKSLVTTLTERGQASLPAALRKELGLQPGHRLRWQKISSREVRLVIEPDAKVKGPTAMLGFAKTFRSPRRTADWMKDLRAGEKA